MKKIQQDLLKGSLITIAVLIISAFVLGLNGFVQAWTPPQFDPPPAEPTDPISAPLNVSSSTQRKIGSLSIDQFGDHGLIPGNALSLHVAYDRVNGVMGDVDDLGLSGLYIEQDVMDGVAGSSYYGYAAYFSHNNIGDVNPDPDTFGTEHQITGGYALGINGNAKINGDLVVVGTVRTLGRALGASTAFSAFQCNRDDTSCQGQTAATCQEKCLEATNPGSGFCGSAWVEDDQGYLKNFTCDDQSGPVGTVICNCLSFD